MIILRYKDLHALHLLEWWKSRKKKHKYKPRVLCCKLSRTIRDSRRMMHGRQFMPNRRQQTKKKTAKQIRSETYINRLRIHRHIFADSRRFESVLSIFLFYFFIFLVLFCGLFCLHAHCLRCMISRLFWNFECQRRLVCFTWMNWTGNPHVLGLTVKSTKKEPHRTNEGNLQAISHWRVSHYTCMCFTATLHNRE